MDLLGEKLLAKILANRKMEMEEASGEEEGELMKEERKVMKMEQMMEWV